MIKKFSMIVFLFTFAAQSKKMYPTARRQASSCATQLGGPTRPSTNATYRSHYKDDRDDIFFEDQETNEKSLYVKRKTPRMTPSNNSKKLRPTGYTEFNREAYQAMNSFLDKQSVDIQKLTKKIESILKKNKEINKKQLCRKLNTFPCALRDYIKEIQKKSPELFKILNKKYPKIFYIRKISKESIECVLEKIEKILNKKEEKFTKSKLCGILGRSLQNFNDFLKRAHRKKSALLKKLAREHPSLILIKKNQKKEEKKSFFKKIEEILDKDKSINMDDLADKLKMPLKLLTAHLTMLERKSLKKFEELKAKSTHALSKEKVIEKGETLEEKIEKILNIDPETDLDNLAEALKTPFNIFIRELKKLERTDPEKFDELKARSTHALSKRKIELEDKILKKVQKKEPISSLLNIIEERNNVKPIKFDEPQGNVSQMKIMIKEETLIEKIEEIINKIIKKNEDMNKTEFIKQLNIPQTTFYRYTIKIKEHYPELFKTLNEKYPKIFDLKKRSKENTESVLKKIEEILTKSEITSRSQVYKTLNLSKGNFKHFLNKAHRENSELFKELAKKYPFLMNKSKKNNLEPEDETIQYMKLDGTPSFKGFSFTGDNVMDQLNSDYGSNSSESEDDDLGK